MRNYSDLILELGDLADVEQGSQEWFNMRLGVCTASSAKEFTAKRDSATYRTYLAENVAQVCTGVCADQINAKTLQWGRDNEETARVAYEFESGAVVKQIPFIYKDGSRRFGCSPDGITDNAQGVEIKCPWNSGVFIQFVCDDKIKPEYFLQCQFSMWVSDREQWDFVNYDPRMRMHSLHYTSLYRDEKQMKIFDECAKWWIDDMDTMLAKMGFKYGDQFTYI